MSRLVSERSLGKEAKPLTEVCWIGGAAFGRVQKEEGKAGAREHNTDEQRAAAPGNGAALSNFRRNLDKTQDHVKYAAYRLQYKSDYNERAAEQRAADRDDRQGQLRKIDSLQPLHRLVSLPARSPYPVAQAAPTVLLNSQFTAGASRW